MENSLLVTFGGAFGQLGAVLAMVLAALGSCLGAGAAGSAAVGAWKKCYAQKKAAPFQLAVFVGAPLSQTIYGMILMLLMMTPARAITSATAGNGLFLLVAGIFAGLSLGLSAFLQGRAAAASCDSFAETGEGFTNNLLVLGIIETVALFTMVFVIIVLPK
jgi:V/A-type H+/Na+-transporting ATPase subunit K